MLYIIVDSYIHTEVKVYHQIRSTIKVIRWGNGTNEKSSLQTAVPKRRHERKDRKAQQERKDAISDETMSIKKKRRSFLKTSIYEDDNDESIEPVLTETVDWSHDESRPDVTVLYV